MRMPRLRPGYIYACLLASLVCLHSAPFARAASQETRGEPFPSVRDLIAMDQLVDVQLSPDGRSVLYEVRKTDFDKNQYWTELWLKRLGGGPPVKLTEGTPSASSYKSLRAQWSPDGRWVAYFSDRKGGNQIWLLSPDTGADEQLTALEGWIGADPRSLQTLFFKWSPDAKTIAFAASFAPTPTQGGADEVRGKVVDVYWGTGIWGRGPASPPTRVWLLDVGTKKARPLSDDSLNVMDVNWAPDGQRLVLSASKENTSDSFIQTDIYSLDVRTGKADNLVRQDGFDSSPVWSPDGKWIAFLSQRGKTDWLYRLWVTVVPAAGGDPVYLTEKFQRETGQTLTGNTPTWSPDSRHLYFPAYYHMANHLFRVAAAGGEVLKVTPGDDYYSHFSFSSDGRKVAFMSENVNTPPEAFVSGLPAFAPTAVTELHARWRTSRLPTVEHVTWKSGEGEFDLHGLLVKPPDFKEGARRPLLVEVQGGPSMVVAKFNHGQSYPILTLAMKGYVIFIPNTRGRGGYGDQFLRAIRDKGDFHPGPYRDLMSGVDYLIGRGIADPDRMGIMGFSYGAGLSAYAVTQTNRFKAGSSQDGMSDMVSAAIQIAGDPSWIDRWRDQFGLTDPWDPNQLREMIRQSPVYHVRDVKTPVLLEAGIYSFAPDQWRMLYQGLQRFKVPSQLIVYPRTGHGIQEPKLLADSYRRNIEWFGYWVLGKGANPLSTPAK